MSLYGRGIIVSELREVYYHSLKEGPACALTEEPVYEVVQLQPVVLRYLFNILVCLASYYGFEFSCFRVIHHRDALISHVLVLLDFDLLAPIRSSGPLSY